jgi:hypothetical protein
MANKTMGTNGYQLANETMALHFGKIANKHLPLNFGKGANKNRIAYCTPIQVNRMNNFYAFAKVYVFYARLVFGVFHSGVLLYANKNKRYGLIGPYRLQVIRLSPQMLVTIYVQACHLQ